MSNHLAIATVTAALRTTLANALAADLPDIGHEVTTERPDSPVNTNKAEVRLYLYQVVPNATWRTNDLPTRRSDGTLMQRPQVGLDLHYLLSFFGQEQAVEPQRLLGSVVRTFHAQPVLSRELIRRMMRADGAPEWLKSSTLADQVELVKFTPLPLSLEELSKLWSVFFQTKYTLSVAYQGSAVLIETDDAPALTLPVRERNLSGQDIFFRQGEYVPGSTTGQEVLAHELTHVMQQGRFTMRHDDVAIVQAQRGQRPPKSAQQSRGARRQRQAYIEKGNKPRRSDRPRPRNRRSPSERSDEQLNAAIQRARRERTQQQEAEQLHAPQPLLHTVPDPAELQSLVRQQTEEQDMRIAEQVQQEEFEEGETTGEESEDIQPDIGEAQHINEADVIRSKIGNILQLLHRYFTLKSQHSKIIIAFEGQQKRGDIGTKINHLRTKMGEFYRAEDSELLNNDQLSIELLEKIKTTYENFVKNALDSIDKNQPRKQGQARSRDNNGMFNPGWTAQSMTNWLRQRLSPQSSDAIIKQVVSDILNGSGKHAEQMNDQHVLHTSHGKGPSSCTVFYIILPNNGIQIVGAGHHVSGMSADYEFDWTNSQFYKTNKQVRLPGNKKTS